jgi:hypothetical protein
MTCALLFVTAGFYTPGRPLTASGMKRHLITFAILLVALALYALGYSGMGAAAFVAGAVFELWFWVRLAVRRTPVAGPEASHPR